MKQSVESITESKFELGAQDLLAERAYQLAGGLLWRDAKQLTLFALVLALPGVLRVLLDANNPVLSAVSSLVTELLRLVLLFLISARLFTHSRLEQWQLEQWQRLPWDRCRTVVTYGLAIWCISMLPFAVELSSIPSQLLLSLASFCASLLLLFFFISVVRGKTELREVIYEASQFVNFDLIMPIRALLMPFAAMLFLSALLSTPFPDTISHLNSEICRALAAVLACYLTVAFGITFALNDQQLDELTHQDLAAIEQLAPTWLGKALNMNNGLICAVLATIVWTNNLSNLYTLPDSTSISITKVKHQNATLTISLTVHDPEFRYQRFHPMLFSLASEQKTVLAPVPIHIRVNGEDLSPDQAVNDTLKHSSINQPINVVLSFDVAARERDIKDIQDIYLWYAGSKKIEKIVVKTLLDPSSNIRYAIFPLLPHA